MIRYALKCAAEHRFESWFQSAAAFDRLADSGHLLCPVCGTGKVEKSLMAPALHAAAPAATTTDRPLTEPASEIERAFATLRRQVEQTSEYVGLNFAAEARAIHAGDAPERAIYGEARLEEARALLAEGLPVAPLPFMPPRKTN